MPNVGLIAWIALLIWLAAAICWVIGRFTPSERATSTSRDLALLALGVVILSWFVHF